MVVDSTPNVTHTDQLAIECDTLITIDNQLLIGLHDFSGQRLLNGTKLITKHTIKVVYMYKNSLI